MPSDITGQLLDRLTALEDALAKLQTGERNIDYIVLRDGVSAPTAVTGLIFIYIDGTSGDLSVRYGDNVTHVIDADT